MNLSVGPNVQGFAGRIPSKSNKDIANTVKSSTKNLLKGQEKPEIKKSFIRKYFECLVEGLETFKTAITQR